MGLCGSGAWVGDRDTCHHTGGGTSWEGGGQRMPLSGADGQGAAFTLLRGRTFCPGFSLELALG